MRRCQGQVKGGMHLVTSNSDLIWRCFVVKLEPDTCGTPGEHCTNPKTTQLSHVLSEWLVVMVVAGLSGNAQAFPCRP